MHPDPDSPTNVKADTMAILAIVVGTYTGFEDWLRASVLGYLRRQTDFCLGEWIIRTFPDDVFSRVNRHTPRLIAIAQSPTAAETPTDHVVELLEVARQYWAGD